MRARICMRPRAALWSSEGTYCTRPGLLEMLSLRVVAIGQEAARAHASQWPPQERVSSGTAHRFDFSTSAFLRRTMQLIEMGSPAFPYEETHPNTHARLDFTPHLRGEDMGCYYLEVAH